MNKNKFLINSCLSNICGSMEYTISSFSMLKLIQHNPVVPSILSTYLSKDIIGQLGGSLCVYKLGTYIDKYPKQITYTSIILQQSAIITECLLPLMPISYFLPVSICTSIIKNLTFISLGSVNTKIMYNLDVGDNIAQYYSHLSIVNTIASSVGMTVGVLLTHYVTDPVLLALFTGGLSIFRLYVAYINLKLLEVTK